MSLFPGSPSCSCSCSMPYFMLHPSLSCEEWCTYASSTLPKASAVCSLIHIRSLLTLDRTGRLALHSHELQVGEGRRGTSPCGLPVGWPDIWWRRLWEEHSPEVSARPNTSGVPTRAHCAPASAFLSVAAGVHAAELSGISVPGDAAVACGHGRLVRLAAAEVRGRPSTADGAVDLKCDILHVRECLAAAEVQGRPLTAIGAMDVTSDILHVKNQLPDSSAI